MMNTKFSDNLIRLEMTASTNDDAFRLHKGENRLAIIANAQSSGKGRMGRSFTSEAGKGIFLSLLENEILAPDITAFSAVVVCRCIKELTSLPATIKWPNDILIRGKKVCGILTEQKNGNVVIGIGINVSNEDFGDLSEVATSLRLEGSDIDKKILLDALLKAFDRMLDDYGTSRAEYINYYQSNSISINCNVWLIKGEIKIPAHTIGIDQNFALKVILEDGSEITVSSGEISLRQR